MGKQIGLSVVAILILIGVGFYYFSMRGSSGKLPRRLAELVEVPTDDKDYRGNPVRKGADPETGWPLEVRAKATGMPLVFVPGGNFSMGSNDGAPDERPAHRVTITKPFYAGKYEVTVREFKVFSDKAGYKTRAEVRGGGTVFAGKDWERKNDANWRKPYLKQDDDHPVVLVAWYDAQKFVEWLNGEFIRRFRLPSEAEWEYLARGKADTKWYWGDSPVQATAYGNLADRSSKILFNLAWSTDADDGFGATAPVGRYKPNAFGIYDTAGNVWEWCDEWYDRQAYRTSAKADPTSRRDPEKNMTNRVIRGGAWLNEVDAARVANRNWFRPGFRNSNIGFRVLLSEP